MESFSSLKNTECFLRKGSKLQRLKSSTELYQKNLTKGLNLLQKIIRNPGIKKNSYILILLPTEVESGQRGKRKWYVLLFPLFYSSLNSNSCPSLCLDIIWDRGMLWAGRQVHGWESSSQRSAARHVQELVGGHLIWHLMKISWLPSEKHI